MEPELDLRVIDYLTQIPLVSVIVIAHTRKEFIIDAIMSVLTQNVDRDKYEIIVIKYFQDIVS